MKRITFTLTIIFFYTLSWSQTYQLDINGDINFTGSLLKNGSLYSIPTSSVIGFRSSHPGSLVLRNNLGWIFQNKIYLTQNTTYSTTGSVPSGSVLYSTIYRNHKSNREELLLNGGTASYDDGHNGASIHIHGNGDSQHPGALALLTGGQGRLLINRFGEVAVGGTSVPWDDTTTIPANNLYNYLDNGQTGLNPATGFEGAMDGVFNIWKPSGKPALYIEGASIDEGDIAWKVGEQFSMGVWDFYATPKFTPYLNIQSDGDLELLAGDIYTASLNGVINCGGGEMTDGINYIGDNYYTPSNVSGDEDLYIEDDLQVGSVAYKPGGGSWSTASDARLKTDITSFTDGLSQVLQINPVRFRYNEKSGFSNLDKQYIGVLAQDVLNVAPYMVKEENFWQKVEEDKNGVEKIIDEGEKFYTFNPSAFDYMLINAIKEQQEMIEQLQNDNQYLKDRITLLEYK